MMRARPLVVSLLVMACAAAGIGCGHAAAPPSHKSRYARQHKGVNPRFMVTLGGDFGAFRRVRRGGEPPDATRLELALGAPSKRSRYGRSCTLQWYPVGVTVSLVARGRVDPCTHGTFERAVLRGRHWRATSGIGPGTRETRARREALRGCRLGFECVVTRYTLSSVPVACLGGERPLVVAWPHWERRVVDELWIQSPDSWCEQRSG